MKIGSQSLLNIWKSSWVHEIKMLQCWGHWSEMRCLYCCVNWISATRSVVGRGLSADTEAVTATSGKDSRWLQGQEPEEPVAGLGEWGGDEGLRNSCSPNFFPESRAENTISQTVRGFNERWVWGNDLRPDFHKVRETLGHIAVLSLALQRAAASITVDIIYGGLFPRFFIKV